MAEEQTLTEGQVAEEQEQRPQAHAGRQPQAAPQEAAQTAPRDETDWKAEARKWEARAKENKAKADAFDAAEEERKSDLQKATESAERYKAEFDALKEKQAHDEAVKRAAREYGVDEDTLARMGGDVEDNAAFLKSKVPKTPAYPQVNDHGDVPVRPVTKEDIDGIKDPAERVRTRAEHLDLYN